MPCGGYASRSCRRWPSRSRIVRLPLNQVGSLNKINKAFARFEQEHERTPSPEELADELDLPKEKVTDTLRVSGRHVSVDAPFSDGEDNSLLDVLVNSDSPIADRGTDQRVARHGSRARPVDADRPRARHHQILFRNRLFRR